MFTITGERRILNARKTWTDSLTSLGIHIPHLNAAAGYPRREVLVQQNVRARRTSVCHNHNSSQVLSGAHLHFPSLVRLARGNCFLPQPILKRKLRFQDGLFCFKQKQRRRVNCLSQRLIRLWWKLLIVNC